MGTRNLFMIKSDGEVKLAKYNQWDGYLDGQGKDLAEFIVNELDFSKLLVGISKLFTLRGDQKGSRTKQENQLLNREVGIEETLRILQSNTCDVLYTYDSQKFLNDSLFCEFAYLLDLDNLTVTVYENGNNIKFTCSLFQYPYKLDKYIQPKMNNLEGVVKFNANTIRVVND